MISKAKSRRTTHRGVTFRYKVSSRPRSQGVYELNITIQSESHNASKLRVTGIVEHDFDEKPPQSREDYRFLPTIQRADIDGFISEAIDRGWNFQARGKDFELSAENELFRLFRPDEEKPKSWYRGRNYGR